MRWNQRTLKKSVGIALFRHFPACFRTVPHYPLIFFQALRWSRNLFIRSPITAVAKTRHMQCESNSFPRPSWPSTIAAQPFPHRTPTPWNMEELWDYVMSGLVLNRRSGNDCGRKQADNTFKRLVSRST